MRFSAPVTMEVAEDAVAPKTAATDNVWPEESAESAFLAEARERGEPVVVAKPREKNGDDGAAGVLPPLNELVQRIPAEVREALEDLFRAKFVAVRRVPEKALKE